MSDLQRVQITPEIPGATAPSKEQTPPAGSQTPPANSTEQKPPQAPERPKWLPEKFKSEQELADAYIALEKKLGEGAPKPGETKPGETPPAEGEKPKSPSPLIPQEKFDEFTKEFQANGQLSEDSMKQL